ncbi:ABC transporter permease [Lentilactobacillus kribbianus]|uniref:ABC transporter permease n=1 Tax=Lentilactobacillus kribbianus TaxID=2729622 RepID=UPI0015576C92|nr:ABC transporter permease [Lentilactobacillus kribbianus]
MNFIKRAWLNTSAKWGRTALLTLVTSAILIFVLAGLLISNAANKATEQAKRSVGSTLTLSANREKAFKKMQASATSSSSSSRPKLTMTPVKLSDAKKIAQNKNISDYNVTVNSSVNAKSFDAVSTTSASPMGNKMGGSGSSTNGDITVTGVSSTNLVSSFQSKSSKITSGRGLTTADAGTNNTVIESELASQDNLKVGDTITVKNPSNSKKTYKLKIVGIYKASSISSTTMMGNDPSNTIYTSYTFANTVKGSKYANTADDASYQTVKKSMSTVSGFANKIVWLVALAGTIILALIVILMVRERRYEIGVLLSLGESRLKIIGQFFAELVIVLVVSLVIAGAGGQLVGNKLGQQLVSSAQTTQTSSSQTTGNQPGSRGEAPGGNRGGAAGGHGPMGSSPTATQKQKATKTKLETKVNATELMELGGFGLSIMFIAVLIGSFGILRLEPKKVLIDD